MGTPPQRVFLPTKRTGHNARQRAARPHCRPAPGHSSNHPHCYPRCRLPTASTSTPAPLHYDRPFRRCAPSAFHPDSPPRGQKPRLPVNSSTSIRRPIPQQNRQSPRIPPPPPKHSFPEATTPAASPRNRRPGLHPTASTTGQPTAAVPQLPRKRPSATRHNHHPRTPSSRHPVRRCAPSALHPDSPPAR